MAKDDIKVFSSKVAKLSDSLIKLETQVRQCKLDLDELISSASEVRVVSLDNIIPLFGDRAEMLEPTPRRRTRKTSTGPDQPPGPGADQPPEAGADQPPE